MIPSFIARDVLFVSEQVPGKFAVCIIALKTPSWLPRRMTRIDGFANALG